MTPTDSTGGEISHPSTPDHPSRPRPRRILLVEDDREIRWAMARYLEHHRFEVVEARDGASAIEAVEAGPPFGFLLTDLSLPDLDGRELARAVRTASPATWNALITGYSIGTDEVEGMGIDRIFLKPVDLGGLARALDDGANGVGEPGPVASGGSGG